MKTLGKNIQYLLILLVNLSFIIKLDGQAPHYSFKKTNNIFDLHNHLILMSYNLDIGGLKPEVFKKKLLDSPGNYFYKGCRAYSGFANNNNLTRANFSDYSQSNLKQFDTGFGMIVASLTPFEKNQFIEKSRKQLTNCNVLGLPKNHPRLDVIGDLNNAPFDEFTTECDYLKIMVKEYKKLYSNSKFFIPDNNSELKLGLDSQKIPIIISAEGSHIFHGKYSSKSNVLSNKFDSSEKENILRNIETMKNWDTRVFCVALDHLLWNKISGNAKSLDKENKRFLINLFTKIPIVYKFMYNNWGIGIKYYTVYKKDSKKEVLYDCLNTRKKLYVEKNEIGESVVRALTCPSGKNNRQVYIDIRHMDISSRLSYYEFIWNMKKKDTGFKCPIIMSHGAVSGHSIKTLSFTGLIPIYDNLKIIKCQSRYLRNHVYGRENQYLITEHPSIWDYCKNLNIYEYSDFRINKHDYNKEKNNILDWYYPWSINLANEEIRIIYESDGLTGIMLEDRLVGKSMKNYQNGELSNDRLYNFLKTKKYDDTFIKKFIDLAPYVRNLLYIVQNSVNDSIEKWKHVCIGSDMDGMIDPIDSYNKSSKIPELKTFLNENYFKLFCQFYGPDSDKKSNMVYNKFSYNSIFNGLTVEQAMDLFFYENGKNFILKYY